MKTFFQLREELQQVQEAKGKIIHQHADGTVVHHSEEDRGEVYTVGNKKTGGLMSSETHTIRTHHYKNSGETVAGNVKKHIEKQAPAIPSHAKKAIQKHMASM